MTDSTETTDSHEGLMLSRRWQLLIGASALFALVAVGYLVYWLIYVRHYESTDDAYVNGNQVQVMAQVPGTVLAIYADDTDLVHAGQQLVKLDPTDTQITLAQSEAELGQTVREVRVLFANNDQLQAELAMRKTEATRQKEDFARRSNLVASGAVSQEELEHSRQTLNSALAALTAAEKNLAASRARVDNTTIQNHPSVARAAARVREAFLASQRTTIRAPVTGYVARRGVQVGQRVAPGGPLMAIVPLNEVWVDANFKEVQLRNMRIGQPVKLTADLYGGHVEYDGKVAGLGIGTGAAFALLPAQNASGNWIKVVQRLAVRVELDDKQLQDHPLRIGLSMHADVDMSKGGQQLAQSPRTSPVYETAALATDEQAATDRIQSIIAENVGHSLTRERTGAAGEPRVAQSRRLQ
jgi:membrane fusion protein, multidrug efflux system